MKKKLLVLAVATALPMTMAMSTAQAGVTIYGKVHASIDYTDPNSYRVIPDVCAMPLDAGDDYICPSVKISPEDVWDVESRASRIGFKGSEDLGDGLKLIWKMESGVNVSGGGNSGGKYWTARNAYIGLAGGWGTFLYGRHDTPLKMSTGKLDLFSDEMGDYNATAGFVDRRADNAIAYVSPSWSGLTLAGAIIPDGVYDGTGDFAGGYSLAAMYTLNSIYLAAAYEDITDLDYDHDNKIWRIGGGWDIGNFFIGAVWENEDYGQKDDLDKYQVSGSYKFGNNKVKAMWADADYDSDVDFNDSGDSWGIGWDYSFSKRSKMYAQYVDSDRKIMSQISQPAGAKGFSFGMVHSF